MAKLIANAEATGRAIVLTATPGPFKDAKELPPNWMTSANVAAQGCTPQLNAFESAFFALQANVYAINNKTSDYQCGANGLLAVKKLSHLKMISASAALQTAWHLPTISVDEQNYLARFSIAIKPDGSSQIFMLASPVNQQTAAEHVQKINAFLTARLEQDLQQAPVQHAAAPR